MFEECDNEFCQLWVRLSQTIFQPVGYRLTVVEPLEAAARVSEFQSFRASCDEHEISLCFKSSVQLRTLKKGNVDFWGGFRGNFQRVSNNCSNFILLWAWFILWVYIHKAFSIVETPYLGHVLVHPKLNESTECLFLCFIKIKESVRESIQRRSERLKTFIRLNCDPAQTGLHHTAQERRSQV